MIWLLSLFLIALCVYSALPRLYNWLRGCDVMDTPNERSSHDTPTPRGAGWAVVGLPALGIVLLIYAVRADYNLMMSLVVLLAGIAVLMLVSGLDDVKPLSARLRFLVHAIVAAGVVLFLPTTLRLWDFMDLAWERVIVIIAFIWMINLTNFIDGINGITCANGVTMAIGAFLAGMMLAGMGGDPAQALTMQMPALLMAGGLLGFLPWNAPRARLFLGDVGSVPLGLWQAYLLVNVAGVYGTPAALLLCLYPLLDASVTLIRRAWNREKIWQAHRGHFYQQAVQNGRTHARTSLEIFVYNLFCLALFGASLYWPRFDVVCLLLGVMGFTVMAWRFTTKAQS